MAPSRRLRSQQEHREEQPPPGRPLVAAEVRQRQRAVAEREASRLARPEVRPHATLEHADRRKSAVSSTPSGVFHLPPAAQSLTQQQESQEWCGPFSVARQLIAKREQLKRQQEEEAASDAMMHHPLDTAMEELETEKKRKAHPSMQWKGNVITIANSNKDSLYAKRQKRVRVIQDGRSGGAGSIPPLFDMCVQFLVDNFEHVESLGHIDSSIHTAIANQLVAAGKLHGSEIIQTLLADPTMESLDLVDCSGITVDELAQGLALLPQLRYLRLHQCGRCFHGPAIVNVLSSTNSSLLALSIGGAHLLKDADAAQIVTTSAPSALEFLACPQLSLQFATSLRDTYSNNNINNNNKLLELCLEDVPALKEEHLELLVASTKEECPLQHLQSLSLRRVTGLTDNIVTRLLSQCGSTLKGLDVSENPQLTDAVLSAIRQYCSGQSASLHALAVSALPQLTNHGLEALFLVVEGQAPPPQLRTLDLSKLDRDAVTDEVLEGALLASNGGSGTSHAGLVRLNVQGAARLTDTALEHLVATCQSTLETVNLSFCCGLTDRGLGYLVDSCGRQLREVQIWGNAQLTDQFYDGHARVNDPTLALVGVWMKQSTSRTVR